MIQLSEYKMISETFIYPKTAATESVEHNNKYQICSPRNETK